VGYAQILFMGFDKRLAWFLIDESAKTAATPSRPPKSNRPLHRQRAEVVTRMLAYLRRRHVSFRAEIKIVNRQGCGYPIALSQEKMKKKAFARSRIAAGDHLAGSKSRFGRRLDSKPVLYRYNRNQQKNRTRPRKRNRPLRRICKKKQWFWNFPAGRALRHL
jgi:hypothetical protein